MSAVPTSSDPSANPSRRFVLLLAGASTASVAGLGRSALASGIASLGPLTASIFAPLVGKYFVVDDDDERWQLRLERVVELPRGARPQALPDPFSLIFSSPWHETLTPQIYLVDNAAIGTVSMFITPIGLDRYE